MIYRAWYYPLRNLCFIEMCFCLFFFQIQSCTCYECLYIPCLSMCFNLSDKFSLIKILSLQDNIFQCGFVFICGLILIIIYWSQIAWGYLVNRYQCLRQHGQTNTLQRPKILQTASLILEMIITIVLHRVLITDRHRDKIQLG